MRKIALACGCCWRLAAPAQAPVASKPASRPGRRADYAAAVAIWRPLAEAGDADAAFNLGQAYRLGRGVPTDLAAAQTWFERAARKGHVDAQTTLGLLLFDTGNRDRRDALAQVGGRTGRASRAADLRHRFVQRRRRGARPGAGLCLCQPRRGAGPGAGQDDAGGNGPADSARTAPEGRRPRAGRRQAAAKPAPAKPGKGGCGKAGGEAAAKATPKPTVATPAKAPVAATAATAHGGSSSAPSPSARRPKPCSRSSRAAALWPDASLSMSPRVRSRGCRPGRSKAAPRRPPPVPLCPPEASPASRCRLS